MSVYDRFPLSAPPLSPGPTRAQQRLLGITGPRQRRTDAENEGLTEVVLSPAAWTQLDAPLHAPGRLSGGLLYGFRLNGVLYVQLVAPGGYAWWWEDQNPLNLDPRYTLGWSDGLRAVYGDALGWVGQWLMYPDRQLGAVALDHAWMSQGMSTRLTDQEHPLLIVGYKDGLIDVRAYRLADVGPDPVPLIWTSTWTDGDEPKQQASSGVSED